METSENTGKRAVWYIVGLNLIAATVVLNIRYNIGVAAFSSVMYAISEIYRISLGTASIICYLIFVMMQCILSRRITLIYLLEIPLSFAFGVLTDVYDWLIPALPFALPTRLLCFTLTMFGYLGRRISMRKKQNGTHADRRHCEHHFRGISSAVFHGQELV